MNYRENPEIQKESENRLNENVRHNIRESLKKQGFDAKKISFNEEWALYYGIPFVQMNKVRVDHISLVDPLNNKKTWEVSNYQEETERLEEWVINFKSWYFSYKYYWLKHRIKYFFTRLFKTEAYLFEQFVLDNDGRFEQAPSMIDLIRDYRAIQLS